MSSFKLAPELIVDRWFNSAEAITLQSLRGRVVVLEAFQMLCPGCVSHGIPQVQRVQETFSRDDVVVLGLHSVFEHHSAMLPVSLEAFLHEYRVSFPVAVDRGDGSGTPETMQAYEMRGTPTLILIDALGRLRQQWFGRPGDMLVGAEIMSLINERHSTAMLTEPGEQESAAGCNDSGCAIPQGPISKR
jgi:peroxiredoxin